MKETKKKIQIPGIGMRIIKSALAVWICFLISMLRGNAGIVFYSQLAALWCMQSYKENTKAKAFQRSIGTTLGALYGLVVLLVTMRWDMNSRKMEIAYALFVSVMIVVVLYTTVLIKKKQASYFSCVVFLSIVVIHFTDVNPYLFVWNRFLDTMIGIFVGVTVNSITLPVHRRRDILFVSGLDDTLLNKNDNMSSYSIVELNRMIDDGALFTISTLRTPASLLEPLQEIRLKLPVIAMDGAVLYDSVEKRYLRAYVISPSMSREIFDLVQKSGLSCYCNVIMDDLLLIYYPKNLDEVNTEMVQKLRRSPYRNYVRRPLPDGEEVVYFMLLEKKEKLEAFYQSLLQQGYGEKLKMLFYESEDYPGYWYLKIYNKNASKKHMIKYLTQNLDVKEIMTFGSIPDQYTHLIEPGDSNQVVRMMHSEFEPIWLKRRKQKSLLHK
ncbi:MAG: HAD hydrolase family protein [Lachnospiraceae bacterium]